jgi:phosphotransferase system HPr (HPr) family protein
MIKEQVVVIDKIGFHARTAALFAKEAATFSAMIKIEFNNKSVNGKSMLAIMTLGVKSNDRIEITADGSDEQATIASLVKLIQNNFNL